MEKEYTANVKLENLTIKVKAAAYPEMNDKIKSIIRQIQNIDGVDFDAFVEYTVNQIPCKDGSLGKFGLATKNMKVRVV